MHLVNRTCENLQKARIGRIASTIILIHCARTGHAQDCRCRIYRHGKIAKLGGVMLFVDNHSSSNI